MASRHELLVFGCRDEDRDVLRRAVESSGARLRTASRPVEVAQRIVARPPVAVFLGVGPGSETNLDLIPVIHGVREDIAVVVIAGRDTVELQRRTRKQGVFYYLVHPLSSSEVQAVVGDVLRHAGR